MVDVTVYGAGVFGLSVAWACAVQGARVQVIDPNGVAAGSSGGIVGALAPHTPENWNDKKAFQFESLIMAASFWRDVENASGLSSGYGRTGRIQPIMDERALTLAQERAVQSQALWQGLAEWSVVGKSEVAGWRPLSPTGLYIRDTLTARIHPKNACLALARAITQNGGAVLQSGDARGKVVWATGWQGLLALNETHHRMIGNGVKGQAALLDLDQRNQPQLFADTVHFVPHADGTLAIGSTSEREFDNPDTTDQQLDDLLKRAATVVPEIANAQVLKRWAGVRPRARSRAPMLGEHPTKQGEFIANGGFKIGFGMAPMVSTMMADLILNGKDAIPEAFRPEASL